jgi:ribosomal protein S6
MVTLITYNSRGTAYMAHYETLLLARTEITKDEVENLEKQFDQLLTDSKGKLNLFDKWGKYKLSYPVNKSIYGVYLFTRYELPKDNADSIFKEINMLFKIKYNDIIKRFVTTKLEGTPSTTYKKPEPIDSRGSSSLDSFIKEHKMEGLIDNVEVADKAPVKKEEPTKVVEEAVQDSEKEAPIPTAETPETTE